MLRNWIVCGKCQTERGWKGTGYNVEKVNYFTFVLGEIVDNGDVLIKKGGNNVVISGGDFSIKCGFCGEEVFKRKEVNGTNSNIGQLRVHREEFSGTFVIGTN